MKKPPTLARAPTRRRSSVPLLVRVGGVLAVGALAVWLIADHRKPEVRRAARTGEPWAQTPASPVFVTGQRATPVGNTPGAATTRDGWSTTEDTVAASDPAPPRLDLPPLPEPPPPPDPQTTRPPMHNPGGVNGDRPPRPVPGLDN